MPSPRVSKVLPEGAPPPPEDAAATTTNYLSPVKAPSAEPPAGSTIVYDIVGDRFPKETSKSPPPKGVTTEAAGLQQQIASEIVDGAVSSALAADAAEKAKATTTPFPPLPKVPSFPPPPPPSSSSFPPPPQKISFSKQAAEPTSAPAAGGSGGGSAGGPPRMPGRRVGDSWGKRSFERREDQQREDYVEPPLDTRTYASSPPAAPPPPPPPRGGALHLHPRHAHRRLLSCRRQASVEPILNDQPPRLPLLRPRIAL